MQLHYYQINTFQTQTQISQIKLNAWGETEN